MDFMRYFRPQPSTGAGPTPIDPQNGVADNYGGGGDGRTGWMSYLQQQGWNGQGMPFQFAQSLRQQGQHPRWDYMHPGQPFPGLGGLMHPNGNGGIVPPQFQGYEPPHGSYGNPYQSPAPVKGNLGANGGGLMGLDALRKRPPLVAT